VTAICEKHRAKYKRKQGPKPNSVFYLSYVHTFLYLQFLYSFISCTGNMLPSPNWLQKWLCATVKRRHTVTILWLQVHALL